jgi:S1-C subfamily serine protease
MSNSLSLNTWRIRMNNEEYFDHFPIKREIIIAQIVMFLLGLSLYPIFVMPRFSLPVGGGQKNATESFRAFIPPFFLDCVVAIGKDTGGGRKQWVASGFLYGELLEQLPQPVEQAPQTGKKYQVYVVTNRHVIQGTNLIYLRFNPEAAEPAREYPIALRNPDGSFTGAVHPDPKVDVAVIPINALVLRQEGIRFSFFQSDSHVADRVKANELGITEGDGIFTLGFPLGLVGGQRNFVIVRQGSIARIRDALVGSRKEFLVDAFIFPGNSGGPVVIKPEAGAISGTKPQGAAYLIGVIRGYVPYREEAVSTQTNQTRIIFEENSGLAAVVPIDFVKETIQEDMKTWPRQ